mgnify:CR=1 FL=1
MNERTAERQPLFRPQDRRRVLVVEDSKTFAIALRQMIEAETGLKVTSCACLKDLSNAILKDQEGYAIAVVDLNLPDAPDGEALDWTVSHGIPTIVFTGTFNAATRARIMEREVFDYVLKDSEFALGNLVSSVKRALTNRETRILVVDDMTTTRRLLAQMLTSQQYTVVEVGSGADALTMLEKDQDIRLVVSDYNMPDMDGFELARRIRDGETTSRALLERFFARVDALNPAINAVVVQARAGAAGLSGDTRSLDGLRRSAEHYVANARRYRAGLTKVAE